MRAINDAIEGADAFAKIMEKLERPTPTTRQDILEQRRDGENRRQRRARERAERKALRKVAS